MASLYGFGYILLGGLMAAFPQQTALIAVKLETYVNDETWEEATPTEQSVAATRFVGLLVSMVGLLMLVFT